MLMAPKFHGDAILSGINPVDGKLSHSSRSFPRSVCNILQIHYERRASARKVYRVIHGQPCPKCTRNIPVVECISMQSSAIKVKNFPFKVSVKFYGHYILNKRWPAPSPILFRFVAARGLDCPLFT